MSGADERAGTPDLDEPFDGLDVQSRAQLAALLASLNQQGYTLVLVLNRFDEIPDFVHYAGVLADCSLTETGEKAVLLRQALIAQLAHSEKLTVLPCRSRMRLQHATGWSLTSRALCCAMGWLLTTIALFLITSAGRLIPVSTGRSSAPTGRVNPRC